MGYESELITTSDGRRLEVARVGVVGGPAVFFHHGTPGSAPLVRAFDESASKRGLCVVTTSRAGYGPSTRHEGRAAVDVVEDVTAALDHYGAEQYVTLGWSGGGPHALACAARDTSRCVAAFSLAGVAPTSADFDWVEGMGPENVLEFEIARAGGPAYEEHIKLQSDFLAAATDDNIIELFGGLLSDVDTAALSDPVARTALFEACAHGCGGSHYGFLDDDIVFMKDWGFALEDVAIPVEVWFGDQDLMVPPTHGRYLSAHLPGARVVHHPEDGHVSIVTNHQDALMDAVEGYLGR